MKAAGTPVAPRRLRPLGTCGGRPFNRTYHFAPMDGGAYPSESPYIRNTIVPSDERHSLIWALAHALQHDLWIVFSLDKSSEEATHRDLNLIRASVWRTAGRNGMRITSQVTHGELYVRHLIEDE